MRIDIFADVSCPWCYISEKRLASLLSSMPGLGVERHWQPFQLQPDMPAAGYRWADFVEQKFGGNARAASMFDRVVAVGAQEGIQFDFHRMATAPNTSDAHRLILFAAKQEREWETADALFAAHFSAGIDVGSRDELVKIAQESGLDGDAARDYLESDANLDAVSASQEIAAQIGISGVPFFIFNNQYAISGAQPAEAFRRAIELAQVATATATE